MNSKDLPINSAPLSMYYHIIIIHTEIIKCCSRVVVMELLYLPVFLNGSCGFSNSFTTLPLYIHILQNANKRILKKEKLSLS